MSAPVIKRRPERRLSKKIRLPGGKTIEAIEIDVEAIMARLQGPCAASVRDRVQDMVGISRTMSRPPSDADLKRLYQLSNEAVGLSGAAGLEELGEAAVSFCRLLDACRNGKAWAAASFDVHIQALQLMAQPDCALDDHARVSMVQGLNGVAERAGAR